MFAIDLCVTVVHRYLLAAAVFVCAGLCAPATVKASAPLTNLPRDFGLRLGVAVATPVFGALDFAYAVKWEWMPPHFAVPELLLGLGWLKIGANGETPDFGATGWFFSAWFSGHAVASLAGAAAVPDPPDAKAAARDSPRRPWRLGVVPTASGLRVQAAAAF